MKTILITENQLKSLIENIINEQQNNINPELEKYKKESNMKIWFLENVVDKIKQIVKPGYPDKIFYVDKNTKEILMEYNKKYGNFWLSYDKIWSYFYFNYSYNDMEIKQLIKDLVGEYYNLWDITPNSIEYVK